MGKIRVKTIGDDTGEKKQKAQAKKRKEAKKLEVVEEVKESKKIKETKETVNAGAITAEAEQKNKPKQKKAKFAKSSQKRSSRYLTVKSLVEKDKVYSLKDALVLLPKLKLAKFDETVELHINTVEGGISGNLVLPHGTGKKMRIAIANATQDAAGVDELVKNIEEGKVDFDILVATPDAMPKLARVAKFLGPRGLMPNPKSGTVTPKPDEVAKKYEAGQVNYKTEAKSPIIHVAVGKVSFGEEKLADNIKAILASIQTKRIKTVTLKSTMSPGIKLAVTSL